MTITVTNEIKHNAVVGGINKYGVAAWDDSNVAWDATLFSWDNKGITVTNESKNNAIITNQSKS